MNNIDKLLFELKDELHNQDCVKEYFHYKNLIGKDDEIKQLEEDAKFHQKEMCKNKENKEVYERELALYTEAQNKLNKNPILINYQTAKDEVYSLLVEIKDLLS